jgi:hypothetical protein
MDFVTFGIVLALSYWARRLAARPHAPRFLLYLPYPLFLGWAVGTFGTVYMLIRAFGRVADGDPSTKATRLAQGISEAMNCAAFEVLLILSALPVLLFYHFRLPRPPGDEPPR